MRKLLSLTTGLAILLCFSLTGSATGSAANPAEPAAPAQDGTMPALTAIAGQGMMSTEAYDDLEELSDYIGARVTGSPQAGQAVQWGMQKMRAMGLENVRAEKWQISRGWTRVSATGRFLDQGKPVRLKINVQNRVTSGPVDSANVVGEIRGTEHPEQVIVVGGHLDSWDLADGATDDGCGVATTLGAAKAIKFSGFKPKRTIRFVLFTGEEQGLLGSIAYTKTHKDELPNHVAALILDNGQGPVVKLNLGGRDDLIPAVKKFADSVKSFGEVEVDDNTVFGTDAGPFILAGLPGINMGQDSPEYKYTHHSAVDTFDKVKPDLLTRDATVMGLTAFWIADRPERLASPWPPEKTAKMLVEKHNDVMLKAFGLWTFGDMGKPDEKKPVSPASPSGGEN